MTSATAVKPIREGFHSITPYLIVEGASNLVQFLEQAFGAKELFRVPRPGGGIMHAEVKIADSIIELADATPQYPPMPTAIHLYVNDVDAVSPLDDLSEGRRRAPVEEIRRNIRAAGQDPIERDGRFDLIQTS